MSNNWTNWPNGPAGNIANYAGFYALMPLDNTATVAPGTNISSHKMDLLVVEH